MTDDRDSNSHIDAPAHGLAVGVSVSLPVGVDVFGSFDVRSSKSSSWGMSGSGLLGASYDGGGSGGGMSVKTTWS